MLSERSSGFSYFVLDILIALPSFMTRFTILSLKRTSSITLSNLSVEKVSTISSFWLSYRIIAAVSILGRESMICRMTLSKTSLILMDFLRSSVTSQINSRFLRSRERRSLNGFVSSPVSIWGSWAEESFSGEDFFSRRSATWNSEFPMDRISFSLIRNSLPGTIPSPLRRVPFLLLRSSTYNRLPFLTNLKCFLEISLPSSVISLSEPRPAKTTSPLKKNTLSFIGPFVTMSFGILDSLIRVSKQYS